MYDQLQYLELCDVYNINNYYYNKFHNGDDDSDADNDTDAFITEK